MHAPVVPASRAASRRPPLLVALAAAGLTLLAACSPAAAPPAASSGTPDRGQATPSAIPAATSSATGTEAPAGTTPLLLEVRSEGGFINPAASIGAPPTVVVDADGRIYTPGTGDAQTPMIPAISVRDTGAAGASAILDAARAAGLADGSAGGGVIADMGAIVFTLEVDGQEVVSRVVQNGPVGAPGLPPGPSGGSSGQPGAAALDLLARLTDPSTPWGGSTAPAVSYSPQAFRVWVARSSGDTPGPTARPGRWPRTRPPSGRPPRRRSELTGFGRGSWWAQRPRRWPERSRPLPPARPSRRTASATASGSSPCSRSSWVAEPIRAGCTPDAPDSCAKPHPRLTQLAGCRHRVVTGGAASGRLAADGGPCGSDAN